MKRLVLLVNFIAIGSFLSSCRTTEEFRSPYDEDQLEQGRFAVSTEAELNEALLGRSEPLDEIWVKFGVTVRRNGDRVLPSFTAIALYQEPSRLKLGFSRFEIGTVYTILIEDQQAKMYANREGRLFYGTLDQLAEKTPMLAGLPPRDLVAGVLMQNELAQVLASGDRAALIDKGEHILVARRHPETRRQYFWLVRKQDALIEEVLIRTPEGREELRIRYQEYQFVENAETGTEHPYPERVFFDLIGENLEIEANVKEYRLAPAFPEAVWSLPDAKEQIPLSQVQFEEIE